MAVRQVYAGNGIQNQTRVKGRMAVFSLVRPFLQRWCVVGVRALRNASFDRQLAFHRPHHGLLIIAVSFTLGCAKFLPAASKKARSPAADVAAFIIVAHWLAGLFIGCCCLLCLSDDVLFRFRRSSSVITGLSRVGISAHACQCRLAGKRKLR